MLKNSALSATLGSAPLGVRCTQESIFLCVAFPYSAACWSFYRQFPPRPRQRRLLLREHLRTRKGISSVSKMIKRPLPAKEGCFVAPYGTATWKEVQCKPPPQIPNVPSRGARPSYVGGGTGYFAQATGNIFSATGSFDNVTGVSAEVGSINGGSQEFPNVYTLQLNTNTFQSSICGALSLCAWQQFVFSQTGCPGAVPCVYMQSWLINHNSQCPSGWTYYPGTNGAPGCYMSSGAKEIPRRPALVDLSKLTLTGITSNDVDTVFLSVANGDVHAMSQPSPMHLAENWSGAEFNIFGVAVVRRPSS